MKALIVADGDVPSRLVVDRILGEEQPALVIAADGGALKAEALGFRPHIVIGDADSLPEAAIQRLRADGVEIQVHPVAKDASDTQLALVEAMELGATQIVVIGAFGGKRMEHTVANLLLLSLPELDGVDVVLADGASEVRLLDSGRSRTLHGEAGDFLSLLPLAPLCEGVTTRGLIYPLNDEPLTQGPARGLSNVFSTEQVTVSLRTGRLLVIHTRHEQ